MVRTYVRRYIKGLYHELGDWLEASRLRCSCLLLFSTIYSEDYMTQFLDELLVSMYKVVIDKSNKDIADNIKLTLRLIGRYCKPSAY